MVRSTPIRCEYGFVHRHRRPNGRLRYRPATNGAGGLNSLIRLFTAAGNQLAASDNAVGPGETTVGFDAFLRYTFAAGGTYYLGVSSATNPTYNPLSGNGDISGGQNSTATTRC